MGTTGTRRPLIARQVTQLRRLLIISLSFLLVLWLFAIGHSWRLGAKELATELYVAGTEQLDRGDYPAAIITLARASYMNPKDAHVLRELGDAFYLAGDQTNAEIAWKQAIDLDPLLRVAIRRPEAKTMKVAAPEYHAGADRDLEALWNESWTLSMSGLSRTSNSKKTPSSRE